LIAAYYIPRLSQSWDAHPYSFIVITATLVISCGLLCEDIGSEIEVRWLDKKMKKRDPKFQERWDKYLQLSLADEIVGKKYLKSLLLRFKFELAMIPANLSLSIGLLWLNAIYAYLPWRNCLFVGLFFVSVIAFLCWEVRQGVAVLDNVRKLLLERVP
jgi:hypothetical protein